MAKSGGTTLHAGLKTHSPAACDKSMTPPKGSVNSDPIRSSTASTPRTLGPRNA